MRRSLPAKLLRIHLSEADRFQGKPLYEAIVARCRDLKIAGATVFKGLEGYGDTAEMHRASLLGHHQPVVIQVVDTADNVARLTEIVESMMDTGMLAASDVEMIRIERVVS
jgi:uncharacterized protein